MAVKVTFTLDEETIQVLELTAHRQRKPKSQVVREAIREHHANADRLTEAERKQLLAVIDRIAAQPPTRPQHEVEAELAELRAVRRLPGRLHPQG